MSRGQLVALALVSAILVLVGGSGIYVATADSVYAGELKARLIYKDYRQLEIALSFYEKEFGHVPSDSVGLAALLPADNSNSEIVKRGFIKRIDDDPWGRPYRYKRLSNRSDNNYEILTYGSDGEPGGAGLMIDCSNTESSEERCTSEHLKSRSHSNIVLYIWSYSLIIALVVLPGTPLYVSGALLRWRKKENIFVGYHLFAFCYVSFLTVLLAVAVTIRW